jgi:predicted Zn-dependent protease
MVDIIQFRGSPPGTYTLSIRLSPRKGDESKPGVLNAALANLPERAKDLFTKGQELAKANDSAGAIEQLKLLTAEFPTFMLGFNELGVAYLRQNELEKADEMFRAALKIEPEAFAPNMNRGITLVTMKKYAEAEPVLRTARKIDEQSAVVRYFLGQALANLGKFDEAEKELVAAVASGSEQMKEAHRILAIIYSTRNDKKRMAAELETYLRLAPNAPDAEQLRKVLDQLRNPAAKTADSSAKPKTP